METAREISKTTGKEILPDARLREWKLGILEGLASEEAEENFPEAYTAFRTEIPDYVIPEGESIRQRYERAVACIQDLALRHSGGEIVVVSHGGVLDDLYRFAMNIPLDRPREFQLFNASLNVFHIDDDRWELVSWGDIQHLDGIGSMGEW
jgi:probable phosphoglycerate mutase